MPSIKDIRICIYTKWDVPSKAITKDHVGAITLDTLTSASTYKVNVTISAVHFCSHLAKFPLNGNVTNIYELESEVSGNDITASTNNVCTVFSFFFGKNLCLPSMYLEKYTEQKTFKRPAKNDIQDETDDRRLGKPRRYRAFIITTCTTFMETLFRNCRTMKFYVQTK